MTYRWARLGLIACVAQGCADDSGGEGGEATAAESSTGGTSGNPSGDPSETSGSSSGSASDSQTTVDPNPSEPPCETDGCTGGSSSSGDAPASLDDCMVQSGVVLDCVEGEEGWRYVVYDPSFGCAAASDFGGDAVSFLFRLDEVQNEEPQIRGVRFGTASERPGSNRLEFRTEAPVAYSELPLDISWPGELEQSAIPAPFSFLSATHDAGALSFESLPPFAEIDEGAVVRGSFSWTGGSYVDTDGDTTTSEGLEMAGCFELPTRSLPLELEE